MPINFGCLALNDIAWAIARKISQTMLIHSSFLSHDRKMQSISWTRVRQPAGESSGGWLCENHVVYEDEENVGRQVERQSDEGGCVFR